MRCLSADRAALLALVYLFAAGCADTAGGTDRSSQHRAHQKTQKIKGGTKDSQTTAIVGLSLKDGAAVCSGTLIAKNLVLTALHCVRENDYFSGCRGSTFGDVYDDIKITTDTTIESADFVPVEAIHQPSGTGLCSRDIALLRLSQNIPNSTATPIPPRLKHPVVAGETYDAVGYGLDGEFGGPSGVRRRKDDQSVSCVGDGCSGSFVGTKDFKGTGPVCDGDSGSGALASDGTVIGVTSRGTDDCDVTLLTDVTKWEGFIQKHAITAAQKGGYPTPVWTNTGPDSDGDGYADDWDNCPSTVNPDQADADDDETGNMCTDDNDGDGVLDEDDNCPNSANAEQMDTDGDGAGDACDPDIDDDGLENEADNCPAVANPSQRDFNGDGEGDHCQDSDGDGVIDAEDNCPSTQNPEQTNSDGGSRGNACDPTPFPPDADDDGIPDREDNCPETPNPEQVDRDGDGKGDVCDDTPGPDFDGDGVRDEADNCPFTENPDQLDSDADGEGDACDDTPYPDADNDGVRDRDDNCPNTSNPEQVDSDMDGTGDPCDEWPEGTADGGPPPEPPTEAGGCSQSGGSPAGPIWWALAAVAGLGLRRQW
jgi:MYXO-CTERM domain-containing protein